VPKVVTLYSAIKLSFYP